MFTSSRCDLLDADENKNGRLAELNNNDDKKSMMISTANDLSKKNVPEVTATYENAISTLNSLQSNAAVIEKARKERSVNAWKNLTNTRHFVEMLEITDEDIRNLRIIHVAGTKGKGSTAAFSEAILRRFGFKTGFFSSPHLIEARERIRINGSSLTREEFAHYFWQTYHRIKQYSHLSRSLNIPEVPSYFMFLTVMAFNVFVTEKVDVAVFEVGIGGEYDCTNFIRDSVVVGITSLGLDHTAILGNTIEEIAWQKSGIFKKGVPAFTVQQEEGALEVMVARAEERECPLILVPPFDSFDLPVGQKLALGIPGDIQKMNASLALKLCQTWLSSKMDPFWYSGLSTPKPFPLSPEYIQGLANCRWPGRYQTLESGFKTRYFLDGAHTLESIELCLQWFQSASKDRISKDREESTQSYESVQKILIFNCTGQREPSVLVRPFMVQDFNVVLFTPNKIEERKTTDSDISNFMIDEDQEMQKVLEIKDEWNKMRQSERCRTRDTNRNDLDQDEVIKTFPCLKDTIDWVKSLDEKEAPPIHVLVTGSLLLVGATLSLLNPVL